MRLFPFRWSLLLILIALLLPSCSDGSDEAGDPTLARTTTVDTAMATFLVDTFADGWNSDDPEAIVAVFADEFYFKGFGQYEPERTDAASMLSYAEALVPVHVRMERTSEVAPTHDGRLRFTTVLQGELPPSLITMELAIEGDKITYLKSVGWEEPG